MRKLHFLSVIVLVSLLSACQKQQDLLSRLNTAAAEGYCYFGQEDATLYGHSWTAWDFSGNPYPTSAADNAGAPFSDMLAVSGKEPAVIGFDLGGIEQCDSLNIDGVPFQSIREAAIVHLQRGGIVTFSWHPLNPITMQSAWDTTAVRQTSTDDIKATITPWLNNINGFFESIFNSKSVNSKIVNQIIFRPWHEHTGWWFWWGQETLTQEQYIDLWQFTYESLSPVREHLLWAYAPNLGVNKESYMERYPGDEYVDILGFDCYQFTEDPTDYTASLSSTLQFMTELGEEHTKPIALTETGYEGLPTADWWTRVLLPAVQDYPIAYLMVWRNAHDKPGHYYGPFPTEPSAPDFLHFLQNPKIKTL